MEPSRSPLRRIARRFRVGFVAFGLLFLLYIIFLPRFGADSSFGASLLSLLVFASLIQGVAWFVAKRRRKRATKKELSRAAFPETPWKMAAAGTTHRKTPTPAKSPKSGIPVDRGAGRWIAPGQPIELHGFTISAGMLYFGQNLRAMNGQIEPALIDPSLPVDVRHPDSSGESLPYWPSYAEISPASRAGYLSWLATGRRDPKAPIGFAFLFFYGLERRLLDDIRKNEFLQSEIPVIQAELRELLAIYGEQSSSFNRYGNEFRDLISAFVSLKIPLAKLAPPGRDLPVWDVPESLRLGLGRFAAEQLPIPASWALTWAWYAPSISVLTPATRCPEMFVRLFALRYRALHGAGITVAKTRRPMALSYRPASSGIQFVNITVNHLSDVVEQHRAIAKLRKSMEQVTSELDPYSRFVGKNPGAATSLEAAAMLPPELVDDSLSEVKKLREWATKWFGASDSFVVSGSEVLRQWGNTTSERLNKMESVRLAQAFGHVGLGLEPDVRFGSPPLRASDQVVVFQTEAVADHTSSAAYNAATTLLHLATAVSAADGTISEGETYLMSSHIELSLHLSAGERVRLHAHLKWLATTEIKLAGLKKRLDALTVEQRTSIGEVAVTLASADGEISPREVTILQRIYSLLGLDGALVTSQLHHSMTSPRPVPGQDPVTVFPGSRGEPGHRIPPRPALSMSPTRQGFALDDHVIRQKLSDTAAVTALLGSIFVDLDEPAGATWATVTSEAVTGASNGHPPGIAVSGPVDTIAGLDARHSALLRMLATYSRISQPEFDELANTVGVMPGGALDVLNEVAIDLLGDPVIEPNEEDDLIIATERIQELLT